MLTSNVEKLILMILGFLYVMTGILKKTAG